ncbi:Major facilitator superfamily [Macrophomina phaseolina MS6]|uniref:Major facilitator superfamily n=1 Tax=Macrophomina phaseolina (strain MS6) TaxID=1126212 RepID=K2S0T5_MACPH|nr:Major facilitator superfamily [Macrophomina phaseolina MS6]
MYRCHQKYGPVVRYAPNRILINTNTALKEIFSHGANVAKSDVYKAMVHSAPNTLTIRDKRDHGRRRRILSQALSESQIRAYESIVLRHIRTLCSNIQAACDANETVDMSLQSDWFAFDVMSEVVFGTKFDALRKEEYRYVMKALEQSNVRVSALVQAACLAWGRLDRYLFPASIRARNKFLGFIGRLLKARTTQDVPRATDVFSYLAGAQDPGGEASLNAAEIRAESATLVVAGSDTSSTTLAATLFYLSSNPHAYDRVRQEVRSAFGSVDEIRIGPKLNSCSYLRACIDEALRMSPPAGGALWREVLPGGLAVGSVLLPEGVDVGVGIYSAHHNPEYFTSPFSYLPERWLEADDASTLESVERAKTAFYPFSLGPRSCVGKALAYHELTLALAHILYKFRFSRAREDAGSANSAQEFVLRDHITGAKRALLLQFSLSGS